VNFEICQRFHFDAAHTLNRQIEREGSLRVHGHTYWCEVALSGQPDANSGMVSDLGHLRAYLAEVRAQLDHHHLNEVPGLGVPTLENLCAFVWRRVCERFDNVVRVRIWRDGVGDGCTLTASVR